MISEDNYKSLEELELNGDVLLFPSMISLSDFFPRASILWFYI